MTGRSITGTIGFGISYVSGRRRVSEPEASTMAFIRCATWRGTKLAATVSQLSADVRNPLPGVSHTTFRGGQRQPLEAIARVVLLLSAEASLEAGERRTRRRFAHVVIA